MAKVNTCVYIEREILETAKELGLNVSKVAENSLVEAIGKLEGQKPETGLISPARPCCRGSGAERTTVARIKAMNVKAW